MDPDDGALGSLSILAMETPDWIALASAVVAAIAIIVTGVVAWISVVAQRRLAQEQRLWDAQSTLYVDLLVWLEPTTRKMKVLRKGLDEVHRQQKREQETLALDRWLDSAINALAAPTDSSLVTDGPERSTADRRSHLMQLWKRVELPLELRERLALFASTDVQRAVQTYQFRQVAPTLLDPAEDPGPWVEQLRDALHADEDVRAVIVQEVSRATARLRIHRPDAMTRAKSAE